MSWSHRRGIVVCMRRDVGGKETPVTRTSHHRCGAFSYDRGQFSTCSRSEVLAENDTSDFCGNEQDASDESGGIQFGLVREPAENRKLHDLSQYNLPRPRCHVRLDKCFNPITASGREHGPQRLRGLKQRAATDEHNLGRASFKLQR